VQAADFFLTASEAVLVMEPCPFRTMREVVVTAPQGYLPEVTACRLGRLLSQAVVHLHQEGVLHRDIRPESIRVSDTLQELKLLDFSVTSSCARGFLTSTGNSLHAAPEVREGGALTQASDIWGLGFCLHFMLLGAIPRRRPAFSARAPHVVLYFSSATGRAATERKTRLSVFSQQALASLLALDPTARPTGKALLDMPCFAEGEEELRATDAEAPAFERADSAEAATAVKRETESEATSAIEEDFFRCERLLSEEGATVVKTEV